MEFYHDSAAKTGMPFRRIWVVELMEVREIVGELTISQTSKCTAEIGWGVAEQYWSRGIGSEIARAGLQTAFDYFKIHRVEARVVPQNKHSIRILERLGFSHEGTLRECRFARGLMWSLALYGILEREFKGKPPA